MPMNPNAMVSAGNVNAMNASAVQMMASVKGNVGGAASGGGVPVGLNPNASALLAQQQNQNQMTAVPNPMQIRQQQEQQQQAMAGQLRPGTYLPFHYPRTAITPDLLKSFVHFHRRWNRIECKYDAHSARSWSYESIECQCNDARVGNGKPKCYACHSKCDHAESSDEFGPTQCTSTNEIKSTRREQCNVRQCSGPTAAATFQSWNE